MGLFKMFYSLVFLSFFMILNVDCYYAMKCNPTKEYSVAIFNSESLFKKLDVTIKAQHQFDSVVANYKKIFEEKQNAIKKLKEAIDTAYGEERRKLINKMNVSLDEYKVEMELIFNPKDGTCMQLNKQYVNPIIDSINHQLDKFRKEKAYDFLVDLRDSSIISYNPKKFDFHNLNKSQCKSKVFELGICDFYAYRNITDTMISILNNNAQ
jgi:hypothetical protein